MPMKQGFRALAEVQRTLPRTSIADVAGVPVEYLVCGAGRPAIVLLGGVGMPHGTWGLVLPELARISTVFAYNRPGVGSSGPAQGPQTGAVVVDTLRGALVAAGVEPPYVLVGHAIAGLYCNLYARTFPEEVAGVVLVESTHPDDDVLERRLRFLPRFMARRSLAKASKQDRRNAEHHCLMHTVRQIEAANPFPDVPLTVVSGAKVPSRWVMSPERVRAHTARQEQLAGLSGLGSRVLAERSGHFPQVTDPQTVVDAVRDMLAVERS